MAAPLLALLTGLLALVPQHLGALHAHEKVLVAVVAFGPFLVLGVVVYLVRKRDLAEEAEEERRGS